MLINRTESITLHATAVSDSAAYSEHVGWSGQVSMRARIRMPVSVRVSYG